MATKTKRKRKKKRKRKTRGYNLIEQHQNPLPKGYPPRFYPEVIGVERTHEQVGDCVIAIKALYALRILYPKAKIVVFTNLKGGGQLYR